MESQDHKQNFKSSIKSATGTHRSVGTTKTAPKLKDDLDYRKLVKNLRDGNKERFESYLDQKIKSEETEPMTEDKPKKIQIGARIEKEIYKEAQKLAIDLEIPIGQFIEDAIKAHIEKHRFQSV